MGSEPITWSCLAVQCSVETKWSVLTLSVNGDCIFPCVWITPIKLVITILMMGHLKKIVMTPTSMPRTSVSHPKVIWPVTRTFMKWTIYKVSQRSFSKLTFSFDHQVLKCGSPELDCGKNYFHWAQALFAISSFK